ncbi:hypothetical protein M8C21_013274 [Ambrosia artemisiifolia]|uniref:Uncharacterized protein n=1 Tax=Ambrosia artemisiifolia TaxID=4212 RepID=A0AAD5CBX3_AMBAR|nr:hypothetical protein M8C21_013274 [Ambrosia artemisiifolia]
MKIEAQDLSGMTPETAKEGTSNVQAVPEVDGTDEDHEEDVNLIRGLVLAISNLYESTSYVNESHPILHHVNRLQKPYKSGEDIHKQGRLSEYNRLE